MSLDKSINHGKEYRKPYFQSGKFDPTCRPNGGCPYCRNNRAHKNKKKECSCKEQVDDVYLVDDIDQSIQEYWEHCSEYENEYTEDGTQKEGINGEGNQGTA